MNETVERYSYTGSIQSGPYLFQPIGLPVFYDIGYRQGDIWYACDDSDSPVKAFSAGGALTDYIWDTVVPAAHGLCFESDQFLWVSDMYNDKLYRINLDPTGIAGGEAQTQVCLASSRNPFNSVVTVSGEGFAPGAVLEVFDMSGRKVLSSPFQGSLTWGEGMASGSYLVMVSDGSSRECLRLVKL